MKRFIAVSLLSFSLLTTSGAYAVCGYVDRIKLNSNNHSIKITNLSAKGRLTVKQIGPLAFDMIDANTPDNCGVGYEAKALVTVVNKTGGKCELTIEDGPYMWEPEVRGAFCQGNLRYLGITASSSHNYTIHLD